MKKIILLFLGFLAGIIVLVNLDSLLALAFSIFVAYIGFYYYKKSDSQATKMLWGGIILIGLFTALSNVSGFFGVLAVLATLYIWHQWRSKEKDKVIPSSANDPFVNFERQWDEITK